MLGGVYAQEASAQNGQEAAHYAPAAGDISGAILLGRGNFLDLNYWDVPAAAGIDPDWYISGTAPYVNVVNTNNNSISNIVGAEVRYFLLDNIALKLSGGAILRETPERINVPGGNNTYIPGTGSNATWIPSQDAVEEDRSLDANVNLGAEYHFSSKYSRLFPYVGATLPFYYARRSLFDPTIITHPNGTAEILDVGMRHTEVLGFGGQVVAGVDYYLMEGLYFGFEIKPVSYLYAYSNKVPGPGLETRLADSHTFSFFSQTFMKIGFRF